MPKHGQRIAPEGVDKNHECWLYARKPYRTHCTYCCYYCEQLKTCEKACENAPDRCGKETYERMKADANDKI